MRQIFRASLFLPVFMLFFSAEVFSQRPTCDPVINADSVLNAVRVDGGFSMSTFSLDCRPGTEPGVSGPSVYHPYNGKKFETHLKNSSGGTINKFVWYGRLASWRIEMDRYEIEGGREALKPVGPGSYTIDFVAEGRSIYKFPFTVKTKESADKFNPRTLYLLDGGWRGKGILTATTPESNPIFYFWLRDSDERADARRRPIPYSLKLIRDRDRSTIAESNEGSLALDHQWYNSRLTLSKPTSTANGKRVLFKLNDILDTNGGYTLELSLDGRTHSTFKLDVRNRKINGQDVPARGFRLPMNAHK
jgi:hypothetical protein